MERPMAKGLILGKLQKKCMLGSGLKVIDMVMAPGQM
jgi:hypothetical protein